MFPGVKGRWLADSDVVPIHAKVQAVLEVEAGKIYVKAAALRARHYYTGASHVVPPHRGEVDWHVGLDGPGPDRALYIEGETGILRGALGKRVGRARRRTRRMLFERRGSRGGSRRRRVRLSGRRRFMRR